jgi:hypothetical protein
MYSCSRHHVPLHSNIKGEKPFCPICEYEEAMGIPLEQPINGGPTRPPLPGGKPYQFRILPKNHEDRDDENPGGDRV